ncbi:hypothetical protein ABZ721_23660 [Streptomyces sp. NPDC006733]|uniref:hypothetical protein n=1 Tax=Streptomyces sp. NPDC006733 TaxID=3155460 RepID=UPI0033F729FD
MAETPLLAGGFMYVPPDHLVLAPDVAAQELMRSCTHWRMARLAPAVLLIGLLVDILCRMSPARELGW